MADIDYDKLGDAVARALKRSGGANLGGTGGSSGGTGSSSGGFDSSKITEGMKDGAGAFVEAAKNSATTWQGLSKHGANFSNDLIGMNVSAAQSRLSLNDFANVIANNGKQMAGLGGSVTRGAEAFGKLSKSFFDSNAGDELQQMGYTAKELNEVLALQASTSRYTMGVEGVAGQKSREAAASLAKEMDAIAKLTGKSKEEQMEAAKKRATDGQIEAKLRLIGIEQGAEAEKAAREGFQKQMAAAEARGMGQMAKEMFATGTVTSEEAATQYALLGEAAQKTGEQMGHLAKGNIAAAEAANKEAEAANAKNQRDPTLLRMAAMGDAAGSVGTILKKSTEDNMALHDSVMGVVKGNTNLLKSQTDYAAALSKIRDDITASQQGRKAPGGERVSGATQAVVATQIGAQNFGAGIAGAIEAKDSKGQSIAGGARRAGEIAEAAANQVAGPGRNTAVNMEDAAKKGQNPQTFVPKPGEAKYEAEARKEKESGGTVGEITNALSKLTNIGADTLNITGKVVGLKGYATGGYVNEPTLATIAEEGPEFVLNQGQMKDTITAAGMSGVKNILGKLPPPDLDKKDEGFKTIYDSMKSIIPKGSTPGINMAEMSKTISTSISSMTGGETTTKRVQSDDSKTAETDLKSVKNQYAEDRTALAAKFKEMMPDATVGERRRAMNSSDEGKALEDKYSALMKPLEKKIEDGISWETSKKQEAVEETKKLITEELAVTLQGQEARLSEIEKEEALKLIGLTEGAEAENEARQKYQAEASAAIEKHSEKIAADIKGAIPIDTEFGDLDGAIKAQQENASKDTASSGSIATPAIDLNAVNLPGFGAQMKANAASVPAAVNKPTEEAKAAADAKTQTDKTPDASKAKEESKPAQRGGKAAALEDVVKSLDMLNITMNKLLSQSEDLGRKQISAMEKNPKNMYS